MTEDQHDKTRLFMTEALRATIFGALQATERDMARYFVVADRHTVGLTLTDGSQVSMEVLLIGELDANGRFVRVVETTRQLSGDARHVDLARAR